MKRSSESQCVISADDIRRAIAVVRWMLFSPHSLIPRRVSPLPRLLTVVIGLVVARLLRLLSRCRCRGCLISQF